MADVLMPRLSDTMEEGVLSRWLKAEGDPVRKGDTLAEVETDKATMELEAYDEGVLERLLVPEGATVPIGQPVAVVGAAAAPTTPPATAPPTTAPAAEPAGPATGARMPTSPLARKIAREHGIDLTTIAGTGPGGRIVRADVETAVAAAEKEKAGPPAEPPAAPAAAPARRPPAAPAVTAVADDEEVPLTPARRVTAQRLTDGAAAPHFSLTSVVDAGALLAFRRQLNDQPATSGTTITVTHLLIRACAITLRAHPPVNSSWAGDKILRHRRIHIGVAVALEDGLIVPVVRDADRKSLGTIAAEASALAERARSGRLDPDEFRGGTFTISNLGMYGVDHFTAVINPPEAAILAVGAATEQPAVHRGELATRTAITLTLSIDHRVLDGATAARFLSDLKDVLQEPLRILV